MSNNKSQINPIDEYLVMLANYLYINQQTNSSSAQYLEIFNAVKSISGIFLKNSQNYHDIKDEHQDIISLDDGTKEVLLDIVETHFDEIYEIGNKIPTANEPLDYGEDLTNNCLELLIEYLQKKYDDNLDEGITIDFRNYKKIMGAVKDVNREFFQEAIKPGANSAEIISGLNNSSKNKLVAVFADFHVVFSDYIFLKNNKGISQEEKSFSSGHTSEESLTSTQSNFKKKFADIEKQRLSDSSSDFSGDETLSSKLEAFSTGLSDDEEYPDDFEPEDDDKSSSSKPHK